MASTSSTLTPIIVPPKKTGSIRRRHPWVLDKSVITPTIAPADGDLVDLVTGEGQFLARGVYNSNSRIRVRLYSWDAELEINNEFWLSRLITAVELRRACGLLAPATACRLIFSEADGLSGLIVDRYADCLVVQITALAMHQRLDMIVEFLQQELSPRAIVVRVDKHIASAEGLEPREEVIAGELPAEPIVFEEHGIAYEVDLVGGQKTGAYLDQRENHAAAARYVNGGRVLDVCTYHGGFALAAAKLGGAKEVIGIDSSAKAVETSAQLAQRNGLENVRFEVGQCFDKLQEYREAGEQFDCVVLDPPRFAGSRREIDKALRAYHRLNRIAVDLLPPGGILVTCSCSGHVVREDFQFMLAGVAQKSGREIQVLEVRGAASDHPVSLTCPESEYLKCFICRVL